MDVSGWWLNAYITVRQFVLVKYHHVSNATWWMLVYSIKTMSIVIVVENVVIT